MLTGAERAVGLVAAATLLSAALGASHIGPTKPTAEAPVITTTATTPLPTPTPTARPTLRPAPTKKATKRAVVVDRPLPPAPPLTGCPVRPSSGGGSPRALPPPAVAESAVPGPVAIRTKATSLDAVRGKGLWVTPFGTSPLDVAAVVAHARTTGVRSMWVRTGGSRQGYYGDQFLGPLVAQAHAVGVRVIAWDFPFLSDPAADARRAQRALNAGIDGFSPDVETRAEGTYLTARRLALYLSLVRAYAGTRPVIATVPRPSSARADFPYSAFPPYVDVFAPMVYWSCKEPGALVKDSLARLGRLLPVAPVGQGYDMGPEGGRRGTPSRAETLRFLDAARRAGALGASLWTLEEAGPQQLRALGDYRWR